MHEDNVMDEGLESRRHWLKAIGAGAGVAALGAVGGSALSAAPAAAGLAGPAAYNAITFRAVDTRISLGKASYGQAGDFSMLKNQNGVYVLNPNTPVVAVAYNLTVTQTESNFGFLAMWPSDLGYPGTSAINWYAPNQTIANGGTVSVGSSLNTGPASVRIYCLGIPAAKTHFIIDVTGYYTPIT